MKLRLSFSEILIAAVVISCIGIELGVSRGVSRLAMDTRAGIESNRSYSVAGVDAAFRWKGLDLRGKYIGQRVGDLAGNVAPVGGRWQTRYMQVAFRLPGTMWEPVLRYSRFTSPHADQSQKQLGMGINYWFERNVVGKLAFESNKGFADTATDANRALMQFAFGL